MKTYMSTRQVHTIGRAKLIVIMFQLLLRAPEGERGHIG